MICYHSNGQLRTEWNCTIFKAQSIIFKTQSINDLSVLISCWSNSVIIEILILQQVTSFYFRQFEAVTQFLLRQYQC